jgi:hypothetical protein
MTAKCATGDEKTTGLNTQSLNISNLMPAQICRREKTPVHLKKIRAPLQWLSLPTGVTLHSTSSTTSLNDFVCFALFCFFLFCLAKMESLLYFCKNDYFFPCEKQGLRANTLA